MPLCKRRYHRDGRLDHDLGLAEIERLENLPRLDRRHPDIIFEPGLELGIGFKNGFDLEFLFLFLVGEGERFDSGNFGIRPDPEIRFGLFLERCEAFGIPAHRHFGQGAGATACQGGQGHSRRSDVAEQFGEFSLNGVGLTAHEPGGASRVGDPDEDKPVHDLAEVDHAIATEMEALHRPSLTELGDEGPHRATRPGDEG